MPYFIGKLNDIRLESEGQEQNDHHQADKEDLRHYTPEEWVREVLPNHLARAWSLSDYYRYAFKYQRGSFEGRKDLVDECFDCWALISVENVDHSLLFGKG
jgi:hypothetical protein